jgi:hypothetical protein
MTERIVRTITFSSRLILGRRIVLSPAEAVDDGEDADDDQPAAHQHVADEEDAHHKVVEEAVEEEGDGVGARLPALARRQRGHHFSASLAYQLRHRNDLVAAGSQRLDQHGQRGNGCGAIPAAVVEKNDGASIPRLRLHVFHLLKNAFGDLLGSLARMLVPVVGIDFVADDDVTQSLDAGYRSRLIVGIGFLVDRIRGTEIERLHAKLRGE